jgi:toxin ParE1/3/4
MEVRWSKTALIELETIFLYINDHSGMGARSVVERIEHASERLELFPYTGEETSEAGTRTLAIVRYPYMLYYAVDESLGEVVILHVRHTARKKPAADDPRAG